jgi:hypothetical protein
MIARTWRCRVLQNHAAGFEEHVVTLSTVQPLRG